MEKNAKLGLIMKILGSLWFSPMGNLIGIVKVQTEYNGIKYYIGSFASGTFKSQEEDEKVIAERGAKFPEEAGKLLMP